MPDDQFDFPVPNYARPLNNWLGVADPPPPPVAPQGPPSWQEAIAANKRTQERKPPIGEQLHDILGKTGQFAAGVATAPINMVSGLYGKVAAADEAARNPSASSDVYADPRAMARDADVPSTALGLMGAGIPFSKPGALGSAGGKAMTAETTGEGQTLADIIRAYHGSPHDFEKFDIGKIGTGEGAQAFGHGLYFAENEGVARGYREQLTKGNSTLTMANGQTFDPSTLEHVNVRAATRNNGADLDKTLARADELLKSETMPEATKDMVRRDRARLQSIKDAGGVSENKGRIYEVAIKAHPDEFLDWDKPLSEQHPKVQEAVRPLLNDPNDLNTAMRKELSERLQSDDEERVLHNWYEDLRRDAKTASDDELDKIWEKQRIIEQWWDNKPSAVSAPEEREASSALNPTGAEIHRILTERATKTPNIVASGDQPSSSAALREAGIPGIKYLDQGSRNVGLNFEVAQKHDGTFDLIKHTGQHEDIVANFESREAANAAREAKMPKATSNYVVFHHDLVDILKKYGIAGLSALPAMGAYHFKDSDIGKQ